MLFVPDYARPLKFNVSPDGNTIFFIYTNCKMQFKKIIVDIERVQIMSNSKFAIKHGFYKKG
ncbi:hypothetical protein D3X37_17440 [Acinetobacter baumannii]|nr:hypothetical protein D3X37_17440 [Acinetobacter baumannii]